MSDFRPLTESELLALSPEQAIAYHHEARRHGRHDEARTALAILVWGFIDRVRFWVSRKLPRQEVEDVVGEVLESAIKSSFDGVEPRQFGSQHSASAIVVPTLIVSAAPVAGRTAVPTSTATVTAIARFTRFITP